MSKKTLLNIYFVAILLFVTFSRSGQSDLFNTSKLLTATAFLFIFLD